MERPVWMRVQENGALGEARTRAFLMDRFWILERSIDIEGADFFIQRRLTSQSLLSRDPPKLGVVQAKFFQDEKTTQYVHREYIEDESGRAREEVFVVCHTGTDDSGKIYFLTAEEVQANFRVATTESREGQYALPGTQILTERWHVTNRFRVLTRIEQALINANFQRNRRFLSWALPSIKQDNSIDPDYLEEIDNWYGSIPREFFELREMARDAAYALDDYMIILKEIAETDSPKVAVAAAERFDSDSLRHIGRDLFSPSFAEAVLAHDRWVQSLKAAGLLDAHATTRGKVLEYISCECLKNIPFESGTLFRVNVEYDFKNLRLISISSSLTTLDAVLAEATDQNLNKYADVIYSESGRVAAFIDPSVYEPWLTNSDEASNSKEYPSRGVHYLVAYVMEQVLDRWHYESD